MDLQLVIRRAAYLLSAIAVMLTIGTVGYVLIDHADPFEAFYMALFTMSTVGYGETIELSRTGRIFNAFYIFFSTSLLFVGIGVMSATVLELQLADHFGRRKTKRMIDKLSGHIIVCGLGRVGRGAALELLRAKAAFVVVDRNDERVDWALKLGMLAVSADCTRDETLRAVHIDRAKGIIAALASDADNLFLTISAKTLNSKVNVSARANEEEAESKMRRAGADSVVAPYNFTGSRLAQSLLRPHVSQFLDFTTTGFGPEVALEQVRVADSSDFVGKSLLELGHLRKDLGIMVLAIRRAKGEMTFNPSAQELVHGGDYLIVMGEAPALRELEAALTPERV